MTPVELSVGWGVLHLFYGIDRDRVDAAGGRGFDHCEAVPTQPGNQLLADAAAAADDHDLHVRRLDAWPAAPPAKS